METWADWRSIAEGVLSALCIWLLIVALVAALEEAARRK